MTDQMQTQEQDQIQDQELFLDIEGDQLIIQTSSDETYLFENLLENFIDDEFDDIENSVIEEDILYKYQTLQKFFEKIQNTIDQKIKETEGYLAEL